MEASRENGMMETETATENTSPLLTDVKIKTEHIGDNSSPLFITMVEDVKVKTECLSDIQNSPFIDTFDDTVEKMKDLSGDQSPSFCGTLEGVKVKMECLSDDESPSITQSLKDFVVKTEMSPRADYPSCVKIEKDSNSQTFPQSLSLYTDVDIKPDDHDEDDDDDDEMQAGHFPKPSRLPTFSLTTQKKDSKSPPLTPAEKMRRYREKLKLDPARKQEVLMKDRVRKTRKYKPVVQMTPKEHMSAKSQWRNSKKKNLSAKQVTPSFIRSQQQIKAFTNFAEERDQLKKEIAYLSAKLRKEQKKTQKYKKRAERKTPKRKGTPQNKAAVKSLQLRFSDRKSFHKKSRFKDSDVPF